MAALLCACSGDPADPPLGQLSLHLDSPTVVALTFDDTTADQFQVAAMAEARGMRLTFYVNSTRFGQSGFMTLDQVRSLQDRGHEIAGHTLSHVNLTTMGAEQARFDICNDRAALLDDGFAVTSFAYPFGGDNATVRQIVNDCGYDSARDIGGLVSISSCSGCPYANPIPPAVPYVLRTSGSVTPSTTLAQLQQYVTQAEQHGGGLVPIVFHRVCEGCDPYAVSPALLGQFLDWLQARPSTTRVATIDEIIGGPMREAVTVAAPAPDPQPPGNLLHNASLETNLDGDQVPDCWKEDGYGNNAATYALVNDAFDGNVAEKITITSWSSGARRLTTNLDYGFCAPPVTPGHTYAMTAAYKSTTPPRFSVQVRGANNVWRWFAESSTLPKSSAYRAATYTTPPMPSDATAISVGLTITGVGTVTMDAFSLVDTSQPPPPPDTTPPSLAIKCNDTACASTPYSDPVTVAVAASDASGVQELRYTTDGNDPTAGTLYSGPFVIAASSLVRATAVDGAGNRASASASIEISSPPPPTNLLANPSLEVDANGNQVPDCWQRGGFGTNIATFTLVPDAYDGSVAQRIDITSFSSGGRRLVSAQDSGTCAPAAQPGRSYVMTGFYKGNVAPRFSMYYRTTAGEWKWFAQSALLPVSATYREASYTTPALPSDATAISGGLSIFEVGWLTTDAYTLQEAP